jgi:Uma2 family endonuclease
MSTVQDVGLTADDLLAMPDERDYELVDGELRERNMSAESSWIAGRTFQLLANAAEGKDLGWMFPEGTGFQCFADDPNRVRRPDTSFVTRTRMPGGPPKTGYGRVAPDLAVEVVSPHDTAYEVNEKLSEWLDAGVTEIWIVMPPRRTVTVYRRGRQPVTCEENQELTLEDLIPGFRCNVAELFPRIAPAS